MSPTQSQLTLMSICDAIAAALEDVTGIARVQSYDKLTGGMNTYPTAQVYVEDVRPVSDTQMDALQRGIQRLSITVHVDILCAQANGPGIGEVHGKMTEIFEDVVTMFQQQKRPYFSLDGIKRMTWHGYRAVFQYANFFYPSLRFVLTLETF